MTMPAVFLLYGDGSALDQGTGDVDDLALLKVHPGYPRGDEAGDLVADGADEVCHVVGRDLVSPVFAKEGDYVPNPVKTWQQQKVYREKSLRKPMPPHYSK